MIALAALASVALVPATAEAKGSKVLRGSFQLVGGDGNYVTGKFGKVQLVDGKRNDKLTVHVRRLAKRVTYTYKLLEGSCGGTEVSGWTYKALKTTRSGVGNSKARSRTFSAGSSAKYHVAVYGPDGQVVVCARLSSKGKAQPVQTRGKSGDAPGKADGRTRGKSDGAPGRVEDKTRGKSDDVPGRADDKVRGKSDEAPRGQGRKPVRR